MKMARLILVLFCVCLCQVYANNPYVVIMTTDPPENPGDGYIVQHKGKDVQLTCVVVDKPEISQVQWTVLNKKLNRSAIQISSATKSEDAFRWAIDTPTPTSWRLRIQNVQEADQGTYTCKVEVVAHNNVFDTRTVRVVENPQIVDLDTSTDMTKNAGEPVTLECYATGTPQPTIRWTRLAGELLPNGGSVMLANTLRIDNVQSADAGYYKCSAMNYAGIDERSIRLTVKFQPEVDTAAPVAKQKTGYVKQLVCNIKGYPLPQAQQISWKKEGLMVEFNDKVQMRLITGAYNRITSIVDIRGVEEEHYGRWECMAKNEKGSGKTYISLVESPVATADNSGRIVSGVPGLFMNIGLFISMVFITCLLQHSNRLH